MVTENMKLLWYIDAPYGRELWMCRVYSGGGGGVGGGSGDVGGLCA